MRRTLYALILLTNSITLADTVWVHRTADDPALSLAVLPGTTPMLVAGYDSGAVTCLAGDKSSSPRVVWTSKIRGSVLALRTMPDIDADGFPEVIATTDVGVVACLSAAGPRAGKIHWSIDVVFNTSEVVILNDTNGDGVCDVAFGGADHRVTLLNGANGKQLWSRYLTAPNDFPYIDCLAHAGDLNGDRVSDIFVRTWGANRWALSGVDGADIWNPRRGSRFLSTLIAAGDTNGDGVSECLESGNDGALILCNGKDGNEIWRCGLGRPLRAIAVSQVARGGDEFDCYAGNAEGKIARVTGATPGTMRVRWTAAIGDVCRKIIILGDIDGDGTSDVVAGAENGIVAALSGADGKRLWQWRGADVVRSLVALPTESAADLPDVAVALLDGTLAVLPGQPRESESAGPAPATTPRTTRSRPVSKQPRATADVKEVPILLYHDVPPMGTLPNTSSPLTNFREQMDLLVENGYTAVSLDEIAAWIEGTGKLPPKPVCITFDGQYSSHDTHVAEILEKRGLFAISYITTDWIGTTNHLDWHELRRLERSGVMQIENHSVNHPSLTTVSADEARRQLTVSNTAISQHLEGKISTHHAYPNGAYSLPVRDIAKDVGFRTVTSVIHRNAYRTDNLFSLPRHTIAEDMPPHRFRAIMDCDPPLHPPLGYKFAGTVGSGWHQPSYADVDAQGRLWVCDYSARNVRVFEPDGTEAASSPITSGLDQTGKSVQMRAPSGIAATPDGQMLVTIAARFGSEPYTGLFRYRASDGNALPGIDVPYAPGDVDISAEGMIYVVDKIIGQWHVYAPNGKEVSGSPFGENVGVNITRGIAVTPDGTRVYTIGEMSRDVRIWRGNATPETASYDRAGTLVESLGDQCGGIDVMDDGTVLVGYNDEGIVVAFDARQRPLGQISGGTVPTLSGPRGVAFQPNGEVLWVVGRFGQIQRWEKSATR